MKKTGIFYSFRSVKTAQQVKKITKILGDAVEAVDADTVSGEEFMSFTNYILAVPTWFDGELPNYWDEFLPSIEDENFKGKNFAIFGGGDQKGYPENFVDGIGLMANFLEEKGGKLVGFTSTEGYEFEGSVAQRGDQFVGLALDIENQAALSNERIEKWTEVLKKEFK
ncbi:flavodoxin [Carboxylicivirga sp. M1479]|uniref:flavodoxin n=1 Tax=Carboxylicivirga sp. M1479 TaxID=2594476 RepID=UPI001177C4EB|nr:flavodoxin [Carboxylicivirga sp. M1479]TRX70400.1 flavodoxin [Carboxylicivirga sp. M1479]